MSLCTIPAFPASRGREVEEAPTGCFAQKRERERDRDVLVDSFGD